MPELKTFLVTYDYAGSSWGFDIKAESHEDARHHLAAIRLWAQVEGELIARVSARVPSPLVTLTCWVSNLFAGRRHA